MLRDRVFLESCVHGRLAEVRANHSRRLYRVSREELNERLQLALDMQNIAAPHMKWASDFLGRMPLSSPH